MLLHVGKGKCLYTRHENLEVTYKMGGTVVGTTVKEKEFQSRVVLQLQTVIKLLGWL